ncbi:MAG: acyl-CoA thioesterase [Chloroflexi bacterium]|nr:acyl-CoA thioesterase [Chloroflexota bacterium]
MSDAHEVATELRVRYAETDAQGIVNDANYFVWFEVARVNYLKALGLNYAELERSGLGFVIAEASCRYYAPAHFDEAIIVKTWVEEVKNRSFSLGYQVVNQDSGQALATGKTVQVFVDASGRPIPIPAQIRDSFARHKRA